MPGAHRRRGRPEDVEVARQHRSTRGRCSTGRAPTRCGGSCSRTARRGPRGAIGHEILDDIVRQFLLTLWNVYALLRHVRERRAAFDPAPSRRPRSRSARCWTGGSLSRLAATVRAARERTRTPTTRPRAGRRDPGLRRRPLELVRPPLAAAVLEPRSGAGGADAAAAFARSARVPRHGGDAAGARSRRSLPTRSGANLAAGRAAGPDSVHLADYPATDDGDLDAELEAAMAAARQIVELGRRVRVETKTRTRQPLAEAVVHLPGRSRRRLRALVPLDRRRAEREDASAFAESRDAFGCVAREARTSRRWGPRLGRRVKEVAAALARDDGSIAGSLAAGDGVAVDLERPDVEVGPDDVDLTQEVREGWGVASRGWRDGRARARRSRPSSGARGSRGSSIRLVQDARKEAGLDVSDRIVLGIVASGEVADAASVHGADDRGRDAGGRSSRTTAVAGSDSTRPTRRSTVIAVVGRASGSSAAPSESSFLAPEQLPERTLAALAVRTVVGRSASVSSIVASAGPLTTRVSSGSLASASEDPSSASRSLLRLVLRLVGGLARRPPRCAVGASAGASAVTGVGGCSPSLARHPFHRFRVPLHEAGQALEERPAPG